VFADAGAGLDWPCLQKPVPPHDLHRLRPCLQKAEPPHVLHLLLSRLCSHTEVPPQSLHMLFCRPCLQKPVPPHDLHRLLCRPCGHFCRGLDTLKVFGRFATPTLLSPSVNKNHYSSSAQLPCPKSSCGCVGMWTPIVGSSRSVTDPLVAAQEMGELSRRSPQMLRPQRRWEIRSLL
jgi:hypothetical protein